MAMYDSNFIETVGEEDALKMFGRNERNKKAVEYALKAGMEENPSDKMGPYKSLLKKLLVSSTKGLPESTGGLYKSKAIEVVPKYMQGYDRGIVKSLSYTFSNITDPRNFNEYYKVGIGIVNEFETKVAKNPQILANLRRKMNKAGTSKTVKIDSVVDVYCKKIFG